MLSISVIATVNAALCERHLVNCPASEELKRECSKASGGGGGWVGELVGGLVAVAAAQPHAAGAAEEGGRLA